MMDLLEDCHTALARLIGPEMEPISIIRRAEEHRIYWRPQATRVVLLAESHVYTSDHELQHSLRPLPDLPLDLPRGFVRLVYCLGYGEDNCLDVPIRNPRNSGTPHFWKIFYSCVYPVSQHADFAGVQVSRTPIARERLRNKLQLLDELRARGIWLVDASIAALYLPQRPKPAPSLLKAALQASWDRYTERLVAATAAEAILCIGVGVAEALRTRLVRLGIPWAAVPQPNTRGLSTEAQMRLFATYRSVCEDPRNIRVVPAAV
jgi:hypothetical protein